MAYCCSNSHCRFYRMEVFMNSILPKSALLRMSGSTPVVIIPSNDGVYFRPLPVVDPEMELFLGGVGKALKKAAKAVGNAVGDAAKAVGNVAEDVAKGVAYVVAAPVNSVTGHVYRPEFETEVGGFLSGLTIQGTDSVHVLGKTFADTISGGYATKLVNEIRKEENKETPFNYAESEVKSTGLLGKFEELSKKGASLIGKIYGDKANESNPLTPFFPTSGSDGYTLTSSTPYEESFADQLQANPMVIVAAIAFFIILVLILLL